MGDGGGLRTVSTTGYPAGDRLLGISTDPLGCPVAAELPSLLLIPVDATRYMNIWAPPAPTSPTALYPVLFFIVGKQSWRAAVQAQGVR